MRTYMTALLLAAGACSAARPYMAAYDHTMLACDTSQTLTFSDYGRWDMGLHGTNIIEANPVLGKDPSPVTLLSWLAITEMAVYFANRSHSKVGDVVLGAVGVAETLAVAHNWQYSPNCGTTTPTLDIITK